MTRDLRRFVSAFNQDPVAINKIDRFYVVRREEGGILETRLEELIVSRAYTRLLLVGGRGSGKTSLNTYLFKRLVRRRDLLSIVVSRNMAPESLDDILRDIMEELKKLYSIGRIQYGGRRRLQNLLRPQRGARALEENLRELVNNSSGLARILVIVDELDKGKASRASEILLQLQDVLGRISGGHRFACYRIASNVQQILRCCVEKSISQNRYSSN